MRQIIVRRLFVLLILLGAAGAFWSLLSGYVADAELNQTASYYIENTPEEVGAANIVTAIIVTYRGLDTLGEVTVLFLTAAIVAVLLNVQKQAQGSALVDKARHNSANSSTKTSNKASAVTGVNASTKKRVSNELLQTASQLLTPLILLFGAYIFIHGHLTPGGGFQGGAIIASAMLLLLLTDPAKRFSHGLIAAIESVSGLAFVGFAIAGLVLAGGFLDNKILPLGEIGELLSAGAIPLIYSLVGLKVGAEFSSMLSSLSETEEQ